jgi:ADP-ribose pyrophosphatase YjhB (NUDIX family)/predicted O-methyltransferase YrrM
MAKKGKYTYDWPRPMLTVDVVAFSLSEGKKLVLLIRRGESPFKEKWAFPGGFVELDEELEAAALRELKEETGLTGLEIEQLCTFGKVDRDPRGRTITVVYAGICKNEDVVTGSDDAIEARWFDVDNLPEMAFDHLEMAKKARCWLESRASKHSHGDLERLNELTWGYRSACVLQVTNRMKLFNALAEGPMELEDICRRCRTKPDITEKVLTACTALGFVEKEGKAYRNSAVAEKYLVEGSELYQGNIIAHSANVKEFWANLTDAVFEQGLDLQEEDAHRNFILGMHNITVGGRGKLFLENIDLSGRHRLLDVGGGPGTYSIMACRCYKQLEAVVFDVPETISITKEVIAKEGMQERVRVQEGDWETDEFGEGYDVILMSNILHGPGSQAKMKLAKAFTAMDKGGLLVIQEFLLNNDKSGPLVPALFNVMVGAYSEQELLLLVEKAGFIGCKVVGSDEKIGCGWITCIKP